MTNKPIKVKLLLPTCYLQTHHPSVEETREGNRSGLVEFSIQPLIVWLWDSLNGFEVGLTESDYVFKILK